MTSVEKFILLAEDDPYVAELVLHALGHGEPPPRVVHVRDGVEALDFLYVRDRFAHREPGDPAVVILDVKMPRLDGLEVLRHIKTDDTLRTTPVIMLTSSHDDSDIRTSYLLGANAYIVKPLEYQRLVGMLDHLRAFWLETNEPPPQRVTVPGTLAG